MGSAIDWVRDSVRERRLAGDSRAGMWGRNRTRDIHWRWVRRNRRFVAITVAGTLVVSGLAAYFIPSPFFAGLMAGGFSVGMMAMLAVMVMMLTGTAYRSMGSTAEMWTASELRPLLRHGWRIANHVSLSVGDIDHVLVGCGGVIAVETKWSANPWTLDPPEPRVRDAIAQVQRNARNLQYWHDLKSAGLTEVARVLFLWGYDEGSAGRPAHPVVIDGTMVIVGARAAAAWRELVKTAPAEISAPQADVYWRALDTHIRKRDAEDEVREPSRPSLFALYWHMAGALAAAVAAVYVFGEALRLRSVPALVATVLGMAIVGFLVRRVRQTRIVALGWIAALVGSVIVLLLLETASHL